MTATPPHLHPRTKRHYTYVMPLAQSNGIGAYADIIKAYARLAEKYEWFSLADEATINSSLFSRIAGHPNNVIVCWSQAIAPSERRAKVIHLYMEAIGDPAKMLPEHLAVWNDYIQHVAPSYDAVAGHTPWAAQQLHDTTGKPSCVIPAGFDTTVMGVPQWDSKDMSKFVYWGSPVGKRVQLIPALARCFPTTFENITGLWGRNLLDQVRASGFQLCVAHSDPGSFSTWRIWQAITTGTVLIAEKGDTWPLQPEHFFEVPSADVNNPLPYFEQLRSILAQPQVAQEKAKRAFEDFKDKFTAERCVFDWLIPEVERLFGAKQIPK